MKAGIRGKMSPERKKAGRAVCFVVLGVLCTAFLVRWQKAERLLEAERSSLAMRSAEQLYESTCRIAEAVGEYRAGGDWRSVQRVLCRSGIAGKQALSYLRLDAASGASLNRYFSDAEGIADCAEEAGLLNELESYTALLHGFLYRERNGYEAYSEDFFASLADLPYYRPGSDAVRAALPAVPGNPAAIDGREALAAARRYLGGSVQLREMVRGEEGAEVYGFYCGNACVLIRKSDGMLFRMIREHRGGIVKKDEETCAAEAKRFLLRADYPDMTETERRVTNNVCFLTFAEKDRPESCVRVGVAMSSGTVCSFSAADYLFD